VAVAAWSSLLALRNGNVSEQAHAEQLRSLRGLLDDQSTIFLGKDDYAIWELRSLRLVNLSRYTYTTPPAVGQRFGVRTAPGDWDAIQSEQLDRYRYAVTAAGPYASRAGWPETEVPLRDACGRYVDWFRRSKNETAPNGL
jgi:hypothetical protein